MSWIPYKYSASQSVCLHCLHSLPSTNTLQDMWEGKILKLLFPSSWAWWFSVPSTSLYWPVEQSFVTDLWPEIIIETVYEYLTELQKCFWFQYCSFKNYFIILTLKWVCCDSHNLNSMSKLCFTPCLKINFSKWNCKFWKSSQGFCMW